MKRRQLNIYKIYQKSLLAPLGINEHPDLLAAVSSLQRREALVAAWIAADAASKLTNWGKRPPTKDKLVFEAIECASMNLLDLAQGKEAYHYGDPEIVDPVSGKREIAAVDTKIPVPRGYKDFDGLVDALLNGYRALATERPHTIQEALKLVRR